MTQLKRNITLRIYDNLPHGVLNFVFAGDEVSAAVDGCCQQLAAAIEALV